MSTYSYITITNPSKKDIIKLTPEYAINLIRQVEKQQKIIDEQQKQINKQQQQINDLNDFIKQTKDSILSNHSSYQATKRMNSYNGFNNNSGGQLFGNTTNTNNTPNKPKYDVFACGGISGGDKKETSSKSNLTLSSKSSSLTSYDPSSRPTYF